MSAEVKREHRLAALACTGWSNPEWTAWADSGGDTHALPDGQIWNFVEENAVAQAIADAEARGRDEADRWWRVRLSTAFADRDLLLRSGTGAR